MILELDKTNNVILTLSERTQNNGSFYLFYLKSKFNNTEERLFLSDNISTHRLRYDEFEIIENDNPNYNNSEVDLFTGEWKYIIYEIDQPILDLNQVTKQLQTGLLIVIGENYN